ncbi:GGDEF domain-containing protein [Caenimonas sedimenti]|uniref:GGDEF domain-containing protein n=1 Tax=Caenimonas sedimenti TaxID=2596921 RepID=A0A562ZXJ9_9BURK|nr:GGDEF domain-containing protein [Caenimonas sedimenti]TWO73342.1 GGDEF domain-containing protein [Caenimonas sedimenti]
MDSLAAAFWGGFFTVAAFMLAAAIGAAARGFWRVAAVGATYSLVPSLFVCSYIGLIPIDDPETQARFLAHLTVLGSVGLTSQLLLVLRGYRKPTTDQRLWLLLLLLGGAILVASWTLPPIWGLWLASAYGFSHGLTLIALALLKARRGNGVAWISVAGVTLALVSLSSLVWIVTHGGVSVAVHGLAATSSMGYVAIMGWAMWMRYAHALELKQVLAQGPSYDPVTRLPSHAHAGKLVGSFLRSGSTQPLGVIAVSLANVAALENLHGRAAYNHALFVSAGRLRRSAPMGAQLGRLGDDGFLVLMRTKDAQLLKHVGAKVLRALAQPIHVGADLDGDDVQAVPTEWTADVGIGITLRRDSDTAGSAVATARAMSRAAFASAGRIAYSESREAPVQEVEVVGR